MEIFSITLSKTYKEKEFYEDLKELYCKLCRNQTVFLFTDSHVKEEGFLEAINNMLTIGLVPALFSEEEVRNEMVSTIRPLAKKNHIIDTPSSLWNYFTEIVK